MLTMVAAGGNDATPEAGEDDASPRSILVELKSVRGNYPFYGELELEAGGAPRRSARRTFGGGRPRDSEASRAQSLRPARDPVASPIGSPARCTMSRTGSPVSCKWVPASSFRTRAWSAPISNGSAAAVTYRTLVRLPPEADLAEVATQLSGLLADDGRHRIETFSEAQPGLRRSFRPDRQLLGRWQRCCRS